MAVEAKYVVIREGEEKMSFTSKKEADAWDKCSILPIFLDTGLSSRQSCWKMGSAKRCRCGWREHKEVLSTHPQNR